jgi:hypothetical protein
MVGLSGVEPLTSRLSSVRSSQLSYRPNGAYLLTAQARAGAQAPHPIQRLIIKKSGANNFLASLHSFERR